MISYATRVRLYFLQFRVLFATCNRYGNLFYQTLPFTLVLVTYLYLAPLAFSWSFVKEGHFNVSPQPTM